MLLDFEKLFKKEIADKNRDDILSFLNTLIKASVDTNDNEKSNYFLSFKNHLDDGKNLCFTSIPEDIIKYLDEYKFLYFLYKNQIFFKEEDFNEFKIMLVNYNLSDVEKSLYLLNNEKQMLNEKLKFLSKDKNV